MITIESNPRDFSSVYRPIRFTMTSDAGIVGLTIRAAVYAYIEGNDIFIGETRIYNEPDLYLYAFNAAGILKGLLTFDRAATGTANGIESACTGSLVKYYCIFTEQYYDDDGIMVDGDSETSDEYWAVQTVMQVDENPIDLDNYIIPSGGGG